MPQVIQLSTFRNPKFAGLTVSQCPVCDAELRAKSRVVDGGQRFVCDNPVHGQFSWTEPAPEA